MAKTKSCFVCDGVGTWARGNRKITCKYCNATGKVKDTTPHDVDTCQCMECSDTRQSQVPPKRWVNPYDRNKE